MAELPWTTQPPCGSAVGYNSTGISVLTGASASDFDVYDGAAVLSNGPLENLRSGDPGDVSTAAYAAIISDNSHNITGLSLSFQYVAGYGGDGAPGGSTLQLLALAPGPCGVSGATLATLYTSPVLEHYPYDVCPTCYSPPMQVNVHGLNIPARAGVVIALRFTDNERNVQLKLPLDATVHWSS